MWKGLFAIPGANNSLVRDDGCICNDIQKMSANLDGVPIGIPSLCAARPFAILSNALPMMPGLQNDWFKVICGNGRRKGQTICLKAPPFTCRPFTPPRSTDGDYSILYLRPS